MAVSNALPPSGAWSGYYAYLNVQQLHRMKLQLMFSQEGAIDGDGIDDIGQFTIRGRFDIAKLQAQWTKTYLGRHSVEYDGVYDGRNILGTWSLPGGTGSFRIWPGENPQGIESDEQIELELPAELVQTTKRL
jgi:hypothetical protein